MLKEDLLAAIDHGSESESVEYKAQFDGSSSADWLEVIKDIVAIANSGGGVIVFGVADSGSLSEFDCAQLSAIDPADLTNKVFKYTGHQFHEFEFLTITHNVQQLFAILVRGVSTPIVFSKAGQYDIGGGKQKTAFSAGTVYFRHGAKSEPGDSDDLRRFVERRIEEIRKSWLDGIVKVVEAPAGSQITIMAPSTVEDARGVRLVNDPSAPAYYHVPIDNTHPYRQMEVVAEVNKALNGARTINAFNLQCIRQAHGTDANLSYCYKQKHASTRYSTEFVAWILQQHAADASFFDSAKVKADELRRAGSG